MINTAPADGMGSLILGREITAASDIDSLPCQREIQVERCSFAGPAFHSNLARVLLDDAVGNGEAKPSSPVLAFPRCILSREKRIVDTVDVLGSNAAPRVGNAYRNAGAI